MLQFKRKYRTLCFDLCNKSQVMTLIATQRKITDHILIYVLSHPAHHPHGSSLRHDRPQTDSPQSYGKACSINNLKCNFSEMSLNR